MLAYGFLQKYFQFYGFLLLLSPFRTQLSDSTNLSQLVEPVLEIEDSDELVIVEGGAAKSYSGFQYDLLRTC
jgi:hypothetical protein